MEQKIVKLTPVVALGDDISQPLPPYTDARRVMRLPKALMGGTEAMRKEGHEYLPMETGESPPKYEARLRRTVLLETYSRTIEKLVGQIFKEPVTVSDENTEDQKEWFKDIDRQGNDLTVFFTRQMKIGIHEGATFWLVEYPPSPGKSLADHKRVGARPYLVKVDPDQVIGWRYTQTNGPAKLVQLRIREKHTKPKGLYGEEVVHRVRLLTPGAWEVHEESNGEWGIAIDDDGNEMKGTTNLDYIPVVCLFLGEMASEMTCRPPLLPLAHLSATHWQSSSDQRNILHYARMMTWFGKGLNADDDGNILMGANRVITSDNEYGDLKVVEHSGAAIGAGRQDLEDLKTEMALFGLSLMIGKTGTVTATEKGIDKGENDSALYTWVRSLNSALSRTLKIMCDYVNQEPTGHIRANDDFSNWLSDEDSALLINAFEANLLPRETVIQELIIRGVITQEIDLVDILAKLEEDQKTLTSLNKLAGSFGALPKESQDATVQ
jgi:hypothetical protein